MLKLWFLANVLLWQFNIEILGSKLGLNVALLAMLGSVWIWKRQRITAFSAKVLFVFAIFLLFSFLAAIAGPCTDKFQKIVISAPILILLTLVGLEIGWRASESDWAKLQNVALWALSVAFAGIAVEILMPGLFPSKALYRDAFKFSGFYSEPSFVAYSLFPCLLILLESQCKKMHRCGLLALCGLVVLSRSSTLFSLIVVWVLYRTIKQRDLGRGMGLILGGFLIVGSAVTLNYDLLVAPTVERIAGVAAADSVDNLSSLVYLQGWQDAWDNLLRTNGLGLGFNMMGCIPLPDVPARAIIANVFNMQINEEDGSVVFGKFISETGVAGLVLFVALIWWWFKMELNLFSSDSKSPAILIQLALILSFIATALIRSTGYFSGSYFLLVVAIAAAVKWQKNRLNQLA